MFLTMNERNSHMSQQEPSSPFLSSSLTYWYVTISSPRGTEIRFRGAEVSRGHISVIFSLRRQPRADFFASLISSPLLRFSRHAFTSRCCHWFSSLIDCRHFLRHCRFSECQLLRRQYCRISSILRDTPFSRGLPPASSRHATPLATPRQRRRYCHAAAAAAAAKITPRRRFITFSLAVRHRLPSRQPLSPEFSPDAAVAS